MAEVNVQIPPDSTGQKLRMESVSPSGTTVLQQVLTIADSSGNLINATANRLLVDGSGVTHPTSTADGSDVAEGAKADTAYAGSGSGSVIAILKGLYALLASTLTTKRALGVTTKTTYTATTTTGQAIASNTARKSLRIVNPVTNTATVYLEFGATAATTSSATFLAPGDTYYEDWASDRINAIVASGTQTLTIYEVA